MSGLSKKDFIEYVRANLPLIYRGYPKKSKSLAPKVEAERCFNLYQNASALAKHGGMDFLVIGNGLIREDGELLETYGVVNSNGAKSAGKGCILVDTQPYCDFSNLAYLLGGIHAAKEFIILADRLLSLLKTPEPSGLKSELNVLRAAGYKLVFSKTEKIFHCVPPCDPPGFLSEPLAIGVLYENFIAKQINFSDFVELAQGACTL